MTGAERREQLLNIGRALFAEKGVEGTSIEEIASRASVSKPVVYEHFGGKEGLYAVVVDRELQVIMEMLYTSIGDARSRSGELEHPRVLIEKAAHALLDYIDSSADGFRILVRDSPVAASTANFSGLLFDIAARVENIFAEQFKARGLDPKLAPLYGQALVGMVALTGQWWLDSRKPGKDEVVAHLVNLAWNGLSNLEQKPRLRTRRK
ncbi:TetR/AcrR family transcriptional regulator [Pseudonocardiaceae bacterium YIM PH 21723]|nr:TetR/AcrR family transcriptional regulator [Pseudonocardiaceae bacterium YIM PH 21723]